MAVYTRAQADRDTYRTLWQECYEYTLPENARFAGPRSTPRRAHDHLFDGTATDAVDQLAASLLGQLTPAWVNWFGLSPGAEVTGTTRANLVPILDQATSILQDQIDHSNLYTELHQAFLDLVVGGTACLQIVPQPIGAATRFMARAIPLHEFIPAEDHHGQLTYVFRPRVVTRADLAAYLGEGGDISGLIATDDDTLEVIDYGRPIGDAYETGLIALVQGGDPVLVATTRHNASPYIVFRWQKVPGAALGRSPVMKALPDIKTANKVVELVLKNASIAAAGLWQADDDGVLNLANITLEPGTIIPKAVGSAGLRPLEMPGRFDVSQLVLDDLRARIRHALLVDQFAQIETRRMTATEVTMRAQESSLLLGAIYGRIQFELLTPLLTRLYALVRETGEIPDLPLDGRVVQLVFRSPMARAQSGRGLEPIYQWLDAVAALGPVGSTLINHAKIAEYVAETLGVSDTLRAPNLSPLSSAEPILTSRD
jgi:hypothetical protein